MKDTFVFRVENRAGIERMDDKDAGALFKAILAHADGEAVDIDSLPPTAQVLYPMIEMQIDRANEKYIETCAKRAESGKKGAEVTNSKKRQKSASAENSTAKTSKDRHTEPDNDIDSDYESPNGDIKEKAPSGPKRKAKSKVEPFEVLFADTPELAQDFVAEAWNRWADDRAERNKPFTAGAALLNAKKLKKISRGDPIRAVKILEAAVERSWQGLFELKEQSSKGKALDWDSVVV